MFWFFRVIQLIPLFIEPLVSSLVPTLLDGDWMADRSVIVALNLPVKITVAYHQYGLCSRMTLYHSKSVRWTHIARLKYCHLAAHGLSISPGNRPSSTSNMTADMTELFLKMA